MQQVYAIEGKVQHYDWGGTDYLPSWLHRKNREAAPWAEYWMGAHPKGPARLKNQDATLDALIERAPDSTVGPAVEARFGSRLPFLFKVLDVQRMLSIQVHPTKAAAEAGFAREEASGPPRDAPDRNYRDDNHKPELGVAVTDFYLLHGFRAADSIRRSLEEVPGWSGLIEVLDARGVKGLYAHVMEAPQSTVDALLEPLHRALSGGSYDRSQPDFWAARAFRQYTQGGHHDRGIFSVYWFNLVHLPPGEAIYQDAGIPHAYLEGVCLELMANSDNVLRGGLTPKHIDVPELLSHTRFDPVVPHKLRPEGRGEWMVYPTPAPDFRLSFVDLPADKVLTIPPHAGPQLLLLWSGSVTINDVLLNEHQRTAFVPDSGQPTLIARQPSRLFRADIDKERLAGGNRQAS